MPNHLCSISDAEAGILTNPVTDPNFVRNGYQPPTGRFLPWFSIKIYAGFDPYQMNYFYVAGSAQGEGVYGSRGFFGFSLFDDRLESSELPFSPVRYQYVEIEDELGLVQAGYISSQPKREIFGLRADGTPLQFLHIECEDLWSRLEQDVYSEVYVNKYQGYILRDAFTRAGLDATEIDPELGTVYSTYPVIDLHPADVISPILGLMDYSYRIEPITRKVRLFARDSAQAVVLRVDEKNWHQIFDPDLEITPDTAGFANKIIVEHELKWAEGTANFEYDSDVVLGHSGTERWSELPDEDLSIQNLETGKIYRINDNTSEGIETNELILEQKYKEPTDDDAGTDVPYLIRGGRTKVVERNQASIDQIKALSGGKGIITRKIVLNNVPLFRSEARLVARAELAIAVREMFFGSGRSDGHRLRTLVSSSPQEGASIEFDLPLTYGVQAKLRIESHRWADISTRDIRPGGEKIQGLSHEFEWTPSVSREQIRELTKELAQNGVNADDNSILDIESLSSTVAFKSCVSIVEPLKSADPNIAEFETSVSLREVQQKTYYFAPADVDQAHFVGPTTFSNFS